MYEILTSIPDLTCLLLRSFFPFMFLPPLGYASSLMFGAEGLCHHSPLSPLLSFPGAVHVVASLLI